MDEYEISFKNLMSSMQYGFKYNEAQAKLFFRI